jgi:hypothetical protein
MSEIHYAVGRRSEKPIAMERTGMRSMKSVGAVPCRNLSGFGISGGAWP